MEFVTTPEAIRVKCNDCQLTWDFEVDTELTIDLAKSVVAVHIAETEHTITIWEKYRMQKS